MGLGCQPDAHQTFINYGRIIDHMVGISTIDDLDIILILLKGEKHVRGIADELKESHSTTLERLHRLEKEDAVDFRTQGKKKIYSIKKTLQAKNYVFNAERYKLMKLLKKYPEMSIIISDILKASSERLVILFGSYAKFSAKKESDIDIYAETRSRKAKEKIEAVHSKIKAKIGEFDLDSLLIKEIIKNHIILRGIEDFYDKTKFFE